MEKEEFKKFQQVAREHFWTAQFGGMVRVWNDDRMWFFSDIEYTEGSNYFKGTFSEEEKNEMNDYVETFFYLSSHNQIYHFLSEFQVS